MQVYCPRCAAAAPTGQRFCKTCGLKLDIIVDAMEGRQVSFDPEVLKEGLRTLGDNLRVGFETWKQESKQTRRLKKEEVKKPSPHDWVGDVAEWGARVGTDVGTDISKAFGGYQSEKTSETRADRKLKMALAKKLPATRKYSLQQGVTQILSGATSAGIWYFVLQQMGRSGFLDNIVQTIASKSEIPTTGLVAVLQLLWLFALIPVATGLGHLINGAFFAAKPEELRLNNYFSTPPVTGINPAQIAAPPAYVAAPPSAVPTNELEREAIPVTHPTSIPQSIPQSIVEDETRRFAEREAQTS